MNNLIVKLYRVSKTILTTKDLALIWGEKNLNERIFYYVKKGVLIRLRRGVFAKSEDYNLKELATSIYIPSYISFETVLREAGVIFQHYDTTFVASRWSKTMAIDGHKFSFRKLKEIVLFNSTGIILKDNYSIAIAERAFLDMIYLFPDYYFDNLDLIDFEKCNKIVHIYNNKELIKRLKKYAE